MPDEPIISPDTRRGERVPPGQRRTHKFPVLHEGPVPPFDPATWDFAAFPVPLVAAVVRLTWAEFQARPQSKVYADMHCVTRWTKLDNLWEGVRTRDLLPLLSIAPEAKFVMVHAEYGYSTNLPLADFFADDAVLATRHNGEPLTPDHGAPLRLVVPRLYAWKSAKWVRGVEFMAEDRPGYWESERNGGFHMRGDPWAGADGERFGRAGDTGSG